MKEERIIGRYEGDKRGPLYIALGGVHGNEPAGVKALEIIFELLHKEPELNPGFQFAGRFVGFRGNVQALQRNRRFVRKDLNRQWTPLNIERVRSLPPQELKAEDLELYELLIGIEQEIADYKPEKFVLLDLHTTTARGGIFSFSTEDPESLHLAVHLHVPVIEGMLEGIRGTTLHYFTNENFEPETIAVCFESGQHEDPLSVNRALAAIINCMRTIGCVRAEDVENRHDQLLQEYSEGLPKVSELLYCHHITPKDEFEMEPNYQNFQPVQEGEVLAFDKNGPIRAEADGLILMPLYQNQGEDGFFIIRKVPDWKEALVE